MEEFFEYCKVNKIPISRKKPILAVIRSVIGLNDRRKVSAYATVLKKALQEKQTPDSFPEWVVANGGIDRVIRGTANVGKTKDSGKTAEANIQSAIKLFQEQVDCFKNVNVETEFDKGELVIGVLRVSSDKRLELLGLDGDKMVLDAALNAIGQNMSEGAAPVLPSKA